MGRVPRPRRSSSRRPRCFRAARDCLGAPGGLGFTRWADARRFSARFGGDRGQVAFHPSCGGYHAPAPGDPVDAERRNRKDAA
jgi:hypothetical protein